MGDLTPAQVKIAKAMREKSLEEAVRDACKSLNLLRYHTLRPKGSPAGFPDDVIVGTRVLYRELKREGEKPSPAQVEWIDRLAAAGQDVAVWRPTDLLSGRILDELQAIVPPRQ